MSMKQRIWYALFFLGAYLLFLGATLPAAQVYRWTQNAMAPVELYHISGTPWRGQAGTLRAGALTLEQASWRWRPTALLLGRVEFELNAALGGKGSLRTIAGRTPGGALYARELQLSAPLDQLATLGGLPDSGLGGRLHAQIERLRVDGGRFHELDGKLDITDARVGAPLDVALGGFTLALSADAASGTVNGVLSDSGGPLRAEGTAALQANGNYTFNARLGARNSTDTTLSQALAMLGRPAADGRVTVNHNGHIPLGNYLPQ